MAFKFRLLLENGNEVGDYLTGVPNWGRGDQVYEEGRATYEVIEVIDLTDIVDQSEETESFLGALVVAPLRP